MKNRNAIVKKLGASITGLSKAIQQLEKTLVESKDRKSNRSTRSLIKFAKSELLDTKNLLKAIRKNDVKTISRLLSIKVLLRKIGIS